MRIFTVARATRFKGIHVLIEAVNILVKKYGVENILVEYGGDGPDVDEFKGMVERLGIGERFVFLGALSDTREKTCESDIVVVPSIWGEAYPLSVIEAMAAGKAVVASRVGGIPEQVGEEECAILVPHSDSERLAAELKDLVSDPTRRAAIGRKARARAEAKFSESVFHEGVISHLMKDLGLRS